MNSLTLVSSQIINFFVSLWNMLLNSWGFLGTGILGLCVIKLITIVIRSFNNTNNS